MSKESIIAAIDAEIGRLEKAKALFASYDGATKVTAKKATKRRTLSAEARARIAAAQKKRWAKQKAGK